VLLHFEQDLTQQEIADALGMSQMQVSRTLSRCPKRLAVTGRAQRQSRAS
jgi:RNA polymerase sigma factor (sigma-70 family)